MLAWLSRSQDLSNTASPPGESYAYRASLVGASHRFDLTDDGLSWRTGRKSVLWRFGDIEAIRLSYRPVSMQARRFRCDLVHLDRTRICILSTSWQTATLMSPQSGYRAFIVQLHRRLEETGTDVKLSGGLQPGIYQLIVISLVLLAIAMAALLVRAVITGEWAGVVFILGFVALFGWQVGGFIRRNRPRNYTFADLPAQLLP